MSQHHIIDKVTMNIGLQRPRDAFDYQNKCSHLLHENLVDIIENACDELSSGQRHLIIDQVEIDLGNISTLNFEWGVAERFKREFVNELALQIQHIDVPATEDKSSYFAGSEGPGTSRDYHWKLISQFLTHGTLPWFVNTQNAPDFEESLLVMASRHGTFHEDLKRLIAEQNCLDRLLGQSSESTLNDIHQKLFAYGVDWSGYLDSLSGVFAAMQSHNENADANQTENPDVESEYGTALYFTENSFPEDSHNRRQLWQLIWRHSLQDSELLTVLTSVWRHVLSHHPAPVHILINKFTQHSQRFKQVEGVGVASYLASLEALKQSLPDIGAIKEQPDVPESDSTEKDVQTPVGNLWAGQTIAESLGRRQFHQAGASDEIEKVETEAEQLESPKDGRLIVDNAGLILFWPYLNTYFTELGLLDMNGFRDVQSQEKALHLVQYLATGEENVPEHRLSLNKILCNWDIQRPLNRFIKLSAKDIEESNRLIDAVIQHWSALGKTSQAGFRQTFVLRRGILQHEGRHWQLHVEKGAFDMLLDQLPWSISKIKLSWMDDLLEVEWRHEE